MDRSALPPIKCLLVDDLEANLLALSALLARSDVQLLTARAGREALELLLVHEVALALLDVQMPDMDGFALAELMRGNERTQHIPLIFVPAGGRAAPAIQRIRNRRRRFYLQASRADYHQKQSGRAFPTLQATSASGSGPRRAD